MNGTEDTKTRKANALALFMQALEQPTQQRAAWLTRKIGDDAALHDEVARLQQADATNAGFLLAPSHNADDRTGEIIGAWHVVDLIATGGMGRVYRVARQDGAFEQDGALKVIRYALADTNPDVASELLRRFNVERQVLANINHPNVAAVLDGGSTTDGLPYLVMEYVEGISIDQYVVDKNLSLPDRLRLFQTLLDALGAVHRNLVVHRDLKPSNILVDASGRLKLLDFGIAKVLQDQAGIDVTQTVPAASAMTPDYASPEQLLGEPVTVATDIYALGLLLYKLLTGIPAYTVSSLPPVQAHELVCTTDPIPPSRAARSLAPAAFSAAQLSGDLDAIVMKAVRKEADQRYGSTAEMANDIERYLTGQPVTAQRQSLAYRTRKYIRRNRLLLAGTGAVIVGLGTGLGVALWQAQLARQSAELAALETRKATAVSDFLQDVFVQADPLEANDNPTVREALSYADKQIGDRFEKHPEVEAAVRRTLGWTQLSLGNFPSARDNLQRAYAMNVAFYGKSHPVSIKNLSDLAWLEYEANDPDQSIALYRQTIELLSNETTVPVPVHLQGTIYNDFGVVLDGVGQVDEAIMNYTKALEFYQAGDADEAEVDIGAAVGNLAAAYHTAGDVEKAEEYYLRHIAMIDESLQAGSRDVRSNLMYTLNNYAVLLGETGRKTQAVGPLRRSADLRKEILGPSHPATARAMLNLSRIHFDLGQLAQAQRDFDELAQLLPDMPDDQDTSLRARILELRLLEEAGEDKSALAKLVQLSAHFEKLSDERFDELRAQLKLQAGSMYAQRGDTDQAQRFFEEGLAIRLARYGADHYLIEDARTQAQKAGIVLPST